MSTPKKRWDELSDEEQKEKVKVALGGKPVGEYKFVHPGGRPVEVVPDLAEYKRLCLDEDPFGKLNDLPEMEYEDALYVVQRRVECNEKTFGKESTNLMLLGWEQQIAKDHALFRNNRDWRNMLLQAIVAHEDFKTDRLDQLTDLHAPGAKDDEDKVRMELITCDFPRALEAIGQVATMGAKKYSDGGWLDVPDAHRRYQGALLRHLLAHNRGELQDPESDLTHLAHAAWNALAMLELQMRLFDPPMEPVIESVFGDLTSEQLAKWASTEAAKANNMMRKVQKREAGS